MGGVTRAEATVGELLGRPDRLKRDPEDGRDLRSGVALSEEAEDVDLPAGELTRHGLRERPRPAVEMGGRVEVEVEVDLILAQGRDTREVGEQAIEGA